MKKVKLYNVIFPIWFVWLLPPLLFIVLGGNFIIDSIVILISFKVLKAVEKTGYSMMELYKKSVFKVWCFGFLSDIIGVIPLILWSFSGSETLHIPHDIESALGMNPFSNIWAFLIIFACLVLASVCIYLFNYNITFKRTVQENALRIKLSLILAIVTAPWTFLLPTRWFYNGF